MSNFDVSVELNFALLDNTAKQVLLDLVYPIGTYFSNDSEAFSTVEKVQAYFGGTWEQITDRVLYATTTNVGQNEGSNSITLTAGQLPAHNHNFSGNNISGEFKMTPRDNILIAIQSLNGYANGCFSGIDWAHDKAYSDSSGSYDGYRGVRFSATPSGSISNTGNNEQIDIRSARRNTYCYHRIG